MDKLAIYTAMDPESSSLLDEILVFDEIDSTNLEAIRRIKRGETGTGLLVAKMQSAGRGRRGRHWLSPVGGAYLSLYRGFSRDGESLQALSLVTAMSVLLALQELGASGLQLKWPNDILVGDSKLAGVLLELQASGGRNYLVIGIGVNLQLPAGVVATLERPATDLATTINGNPETVAVIAGIVSRLLRNIQVFEAEGFAPFQEQWNSHDRYLGRDIVIQAGTARTQGKSLGVDHNGALVLQTPTGRQLINGGEVFPSLREAEENADL